MRRPARVHLLMAAVLAGIALLVAELAAGGLGHGGSTRATACGREAPPAIEGGGVDRAVQRIVLDGLEEAACALGTTREELVLSFGPSPAGEPVRWDAETIERAVRGGLEGAIDRAEARGDVPSLVAGGLRAIARRAPVAWLVGRGEDVGGLVDALRRLIG
jgi:hypothetical protein